MEMVSSCGVTLPAPGLQSLSGITILKQNTALAPVGSENVAGLFSFSLSMLSEISHLLLKCK